jgi:signal transduction histidine kinase
MPADLVLTASAQSQTFPQKITSDDDKKVLLAKANEAMYKQNFELTIRNKTLLVLRRLSDITIQANSVSEVTQLIVDTIVQELNFTAAIISLIDHNTNTLHPVAITKSAQMTEALHSIGKPPEELYIPMDDANNLAINAIRDVEQKVTGNILDILTPLVTQNTADQIERITKIKTIIIYPLILGSHALGVLCLGLPKNVDDLSRAEKETLTELIGVVSIAINRAQLIESTRVANEKLTAANKQLEVLDKLKNEFVSLASHELRTPMTAIKSYAWLVLNGKAGPLEPKARDYLTRVFISTQRLIHLVNEMLDISRIESGKVQLKKEPLDLAQLASDVQGEFQAKSNELHLTLSIDISENLPKPPADREKIHQVLENLVGNAFKFTPKDGSVKITMKPLPDAVEIAVSDTGRGIHPEDLTKLFTKFGRLEGSYITITGSGSGLGLYICKQYVELHGGKIWAQSEVNTGSTFTFTLPVN